MENKTKKMLAMLSACLLMTSAGGSVLCHAAVSANPAESVTAQAKAVSAADFLGIWGCGRCTIKIEQEDAPENGYKVLIHWSSSAASYTEWEYRCCSLKNGKLVCEKEGTCAVFTYTSADSEPDVKTQYINSSAEFILENNTLFWNDKKEASGEGMTFIKSDVPAVSDVTVQDFLGTWGCGRCTIEIAQEDAPENGYKVLIHWSSSADSYTEWEYRCCYFQNGKLVCDKEGTCAVLTYKSAGSLPDVQTQYINSSAEFIIENNTLFWNDKKEAAGEGMTFIKSDVPSVSDTTIQDFLGTWGCGRCTIQIEPEDAPENGYKVTIRWSSSAASYTTWIYNCCRLDNGRLVCEKEGTCAVITYPSADSEPVTETQYINSSAVFTVDNDVLYWNDLKEDSGNGMTFIRNAEVISDATIEDFLGNWGCGRCSISIEPEDAVENGYKVTIQWSSSAASYTKWIYDCCYLKNGKLVCEKQGTCAVVTYPSADSEPVVETQYINSSAEFGIVDNTLFWNDLKEDSGNGMVFIKSEIVEEDYVLGDADGSGKIDIMDVIVVNKAVLGKTQLSAAQLKAADVNHNNKPDASDSLMIMKYIVGLISSFEA